MEPVRNYCEDQVRAFDRDRYIAVLFAPERHRGALLALYAFDIELSRVRELAREPMPGEIRLQWWREVVDGDRDDEARANPVAAALRDALDNKLLARDRLQAMIDVRSFDLYNEPFMTVADWERYCDRTAGAVIDGAMTILTGLDVTHSGAKLHAGRALSVLTVLRHLPVHLSRGQCPVPMEILNKFGAKLDDGLRGRMTPEWQAALAEMRSRARRDLDSAATMIDEIPEAAWPALLSCAVIGTTLTRMNRAGDDPLHPDELPRWRRQWLIWRAAGRPGRIFR